MPEVRIKLPSPHSEEQRLIFMALNTPGLLETWCPCGTKFGKTLGGGTALSLVMPIRRQRIYRWVAPIYAQALIGARYVKRMLPPDPFLIPLEYSVKIPAVETVLEFRTGEKPENLEGEGCHGYILDECSKMKEQVYASAKTTVTLTEGPILAISTPRGKNWFYHKCMEAREEMNWAINKGLKPSKIFITAPTSKNPKVKASVIEEARKSLPDRLFRQYYLAEFMDDSSVFAGFRETYYTPPLDLYDEHQLWLHPDSKESNVVIGADWAKTVDWTVFFAACIKTKRVIAFERFHKRPYTEAIRQLVRFSRRFKETLAVWHDKTGVGEAIDDQLAYTDLPYEGKVFTNKSKTEMVNKLITRVESKQIGLPRWNVLDLEMDAYEVTTNELGTMKYSAPSGQHDDTVSALMLTNAALEQYSEREYDIKFLEELEADAKKHGDKKLSGLEAYYADIQEDGDF